MLRYFGTLPGQTNMEFGGEINRMPHAVKLEFHAMLCAAGYECAPPAEKKS